MDTISSNFASDHLHCDVLFCRAENYVQSNDWQQAKKVFIEFVEEMEWHFTKETDVLFPSLVERNSNALGPTQMMRMEHEDMRQLMEDMQKQVDNRDADNYLGLSETLLIMLHQHNTKEENILYQMADGLLGADQREILAQASAVKKQGAVIL
ncbi:MAG: hemerythrin domain-containing protein [Gammaproteobacteria bacterium]|nr:hemerythrin domain-containing protein [Gammaproteobacteria bacterium]